MRTTAHICSPLQLAAITALFWCCSLSAAEKGAAAAGRSSIDRIKPVTSDLNTDINATYRRDIKKRYAAQDVKMAEAVKLVEKGKFAEGVRLAESVRDELKLESEYVKGEVVASRLSEAEALVTRLRIAWGKDKLQAANKAFINNRLPDAVIYAAEAARIAPSLQADAEDMRRRCQGRERSEKFQSQTALSVANPNLRNLRSEAATLMTEAKVFFENKRYAQALDKIEQVYLRDPFNLEAVALAGQIYRVFFTTGYYRHRADFELLSAYTTWQWSEPVFEAPEPQKEITVEEKGDSRKAMNDKLNSTILPEYKYARGDAKGAVNRLRLYLKQNRLGIEIQDSTSTEDADSLGKVKLDLKNVSVGDVLRYISLMSGLKYRVEPKAVRIGTSVETMYNRSYEIQPHVIGMVYSQISSGDNRSSSSGEENIFRKKSAEKTGDAKAERRIQREEESEEEMKLTEIADIKVTAAMFKEYLVKHGITFGEDSSISYIENNHTLVVKNTIENLDAISQLIRDQNALQSRLLLVEVKCIEISENDMEELGFEWTLGDTNLNSNMTNEGVTVDSSKGGWMLGSGNNLRTNEKGEKGSMSPLRTGFMDGSSSVALIKNLNIFPLLFGSRTPFGSDVPLNLSLTINALSQNTRTEVISAPKIVTNSGVRAEATLTKSHYFPDSWSDLEVDTETADNEVTYEIKRPTPEFGDEQKIGISLQVTPTVTETGTINLDLDFEVTGTNGNDEFTFVLSGVVNGRAVSHSFTVWKPVITERTIKTNIDVYDGQTVVVGSSTDNRTLTRTDKIPFLGELPLIGRLFQSQSEKSERKNMLVFVTARRLGTDGAPINSPNRGMPDFNR